MQKLQPAVIVCFAALLCSCDGGSSGGPSPAASAPFASPSIEVFQGGASAAWSTSSFGHSLVTPMTQAPFPHSSRSYSDDRVLIFLPHGYRVGADLDVLIHFHGHNNEILNSDQFHRYREQLTMAQRNVVLVQPQGPRYAADSSIGKLGEQGGLRRFVEELVGVLIKEGAAPQGATLRALALSGHSGGYKAIAAGLTVGELDDKVTEVYLHDGLYGQRAAYLSWARAPGRRLISSYQGSGSTSSQNLALSAELGAAGRIVHDQLSDAALSSGESIIVRVDHSHNNVVRGRLGFARMLSHSRLSGLGAPRPELSSVRAASGFVTLRWASLDNDACRGLRVERQADGSGPFVRIQDEASLGSGATSVSVPLHSSLDVFRVIAVDDQGREGEPSHAYPVAPDGPGRRLLIVDGFHRSDGGSFDTRGHALSPIHAAAAGHAGHGVDSCSAQAIADGEVNLGDYTMVDWLLGDQSSGDQSLTEREQEAISAYLFTGGALLISGSELAYDLSSGSATDRAFLGDMLTAGFVADRASGATLVGEAAFANLSLSFGGAGAAYPEDYPDALSARGSEVVLRYADGQAAGLSYEGRFGSSTKPSASFVLGLPFETIDTTAQREALMARILAVFEDFNDRSGR